MAREGCTDEPEEVLSLGMEALMRAALEEILEEEAERRSCGAPTPWNRALIKVDEALGAETEEEMVPLLQEALALDPQCLLALILLAHAAETPDEELELTRKAFRIAKEEVPRSAFVQVAGRFRDYFETRRYLDTRFLLARALEQVGEFEEALSHCESIVLLDSEDDRDVALYMVYLLLRMQCEGRARKWYNNCAILRDPAWSYARALMDFQKHGPGPKAEKALNRALGYDDMVAVYLLRGEEATEGSDAGDDPDFWEDAPRYYRESLNAWEATPGALQWLAERVDAD